MGFAHAYCSNRECQALSQIINCLCDHLRFVRRFRSAVDDALACRTAKEVRPPSVGGLFHFHSSSWRLRFGPRHVTIPPFPTTKKQRPRHAEDACRGRLPPLGVPGDQNLRAAQHNERPRGECEPSHTWPVLNLRLSSSLLAIAIVILSVVISAWWARN
jgi:hypothetical protein